MFYTNGLEYGQPTDLIACGSFGTVHATDKGYAVKRYLPADEYGEPVNYLREVSILKKLNHPNILRVLGFSMRCLYMELADCTFDVYMTQYFNGENITTAEWYLYQLVRAIEVCHRHNIAHRDVKPSNILLFRYKLKLADFGHAKYGFVEGNTHTGDVVTLGWRAPEVLAGEPYNKSVDIWSVGVIILTLLIKYNPFDRKTAEKQIRAIQQFLKFPSVIHDLQPIKKDIVKQMLTVADSRITAADTLQHPYFNAVRKDIECLLPAERVNETPPPLENASVLDWLRSTFIEYTLQENTYVLAARIFDKYTRVIQVKREQLQCVAVVALSIAVKLLEIDLLSVDDLVELTGEGTAEDLHNLEKNIIQVLDFDLY